MTRPCLVIPATGVLFLAAFTAQAGTVAHWRFETGPAITPVLHSTAAGVFDGTTPDASGNGNHLSVWSQGGGSGYAYRTDVPLTVVPGTGGSNRFSVKNTGGYPTMFTAATASSPTGINLDTLRPPQFTVEASYKPEASAGYRTVVGRDARTVAVDNGDLAAFYLQVRPDDSVGAAFVDVSGFTHRAYSPPGWLYGFNFGSNPEGTGAPWYNLAAVSDGATLKLYVDNVLVASTDLTLSGSPNTALARGSVSGGDWTTGAWSVGRGLYAGAHTDRAYGFIDEVRISDSALTPDLLLFAPRPYIAETHVSNGLVTLQVERGQPGVTCSVLHSYDPRLPVSRWAPIGTRAFDSNGAFSFSTGVNPASPPRFFALKAPIQPPAAGAMTYSLAGDWSPDARERIIYAMEGAVAQYNRYGTFRKHVWANYSPGTPTADGSYSGWINFGSNAAYQNYRTALHEISHTLGVGTTTQWTSLMQNGAWTGANAVQQLQAFDGAGAVPHGDNWHFWPYGLNYDSEGNTENCRRHVLMVAAFRRDMGIE